MKTVILAKDSQILTNGGKTLDNTIKDVNDKIDNIPQPTGGATVVEVLNRTGSAEIKISEADYDEILANFGTGKIYKVCSVDYGAYGDLIACDFSGTLGIQMYGIQPSGNTYSPALFNVVK